MYNKKEGEFCLQNAIRWGKAGEHIVCAELLIKGYSASIIDDHASPFDIILNDSGTLYKIQVKTNVKPRLNVSPNTARKKTLKYTNVPSYYFNTSSNGVKRTGGYERKDIDIFALVALDTKIVAYVPFADKRTSICMRSPEFKGQYYNERWQTIRPKILELREKGLTYQDIEKEIGIPKSSSVQYRKRQMSAKGEMGGFYIDKFKLEFCLDFIKSGKIIKNGNLLKEYLMLNPNIA